jgi:uncharacterized membrane protein (DUF485 family)
MAGFQTDGPNAAPAETAPDDSRRNTRYGLFLFGAYLLIYSGFVLLNAFWPSVMGREVAGGINVAIAYGMGLIIAALALALIYGWLCRSSGGPS